MSFPCYIESPDAKDLSINVVTEKIEIEEVKKALKNNVDFESDYWNQMKASKRLRKMKGMVNLNDEV